MKKDAEKSKSSKTKGKGRQVEEVEEQMDDETAQRLEEVDNMPEDQLDQGYEDAPQHGTTRAREINESIDSQPRPSKKARFEVGDENAGQRKRRGRQHKEHQVLREGKELSFR